MLALVQFSWWELLFALVIGHAFGDFVFQSDFMARAKCPGYWSGRALDQRQDWMLVLAAHALIHAGLVWAITGSVVLGLVELVLHGLIDGVKCGGRCGFGVDQALHLMCKVLYVGVMCVL